MPEPSGTAESRQVEKRRCSHGRIAVKVRVSDDPDAPLRAYWSHMDGGLCDDPC